VARLVLARRARAELLELDWPLMRGRLRGLYSLRVGSYRIIYQLADNDKTVRVATIRHRSIAYGSDPR